jgi:hypothetical protein
VITGNDGTTYEKGTTADGSVYFTVSEPGGIAHNAGIASTLGYLSRHSDLTVSGPGESTQYSTQLDHFDGKLSDIYSRNGFEEYDRWKFNDEMAPGDWDYEKYGRPDIVLRRIRKGEIDEWAIKMKNFQRRLDFID